MPRPPALLAVAALLLSLAGCASDEVPDAPVAVTSAEDLTRRMADRFADSFGDAERFTVYMGGFRSVYTLNPDTAQMERFRMVLTPTDSASTDPAIQMLVQSHLPNVPLLAEGFRDGQFSGPFERDGVPVYLLESAQAGAAGGGADAAGDLGGASMRLYVDARTFDVREIYRAVPMDSLARPITQRLLYDDFRTTDGVRIPWRLRQVESGFDQFFDDTQRILQGGQLGLRKQALEGTPASPARDAQIAQIDREVRAMNEGISETGVSVSRMTVGDER